MVKIKSTRDKNQNHWRNILIFLLPTTLIVWIIFIILNKSPKKVSSPSLAKNPNDIAKEVPGIKISLTGNDNKPIEVVYAEPSSHSKGLVLVFHACTHNGLKLFSPSPTCKECIGLSEEVRMVRFILQRGYTVVSITSSTKNGCWSNKDIPKIETVLQHDKFNTFHRIIAVGASSGGFMAGQLLSMQKVQAAIVMIMGLSPQIVSKLSSLLDSNNPPILYFAPMPNDKGTTKRVVDNYNTLSKNKPSSSIALDTKTCTSLPVTTQYLLQRVPNLSMPHAEYIHNTLKQNEYIHPSTNLFLMNPTNTPWRILVSPKNETFLFDKYVLTPGYSPLAKALHRAWAFHEYCSDVIYPSFDFIEQQLKIYY